MQITGNYVPNVFSPLTKALPVEQAALALPAVSMVSEDQTTFGRLQSPSKQSGLKQLMTKTGILLGALGTFATVTGFQPVEARERYNPNPPLTRTEKVIRVILGCKNRQWSGGPCKTIEDKNDRHYLGPVYSREADEARQRLIRQNQRRRRG